MEGTVRFNRVLLKLSGEALSSGGDAISPETVSHVAAEVKSVCELGVQVGLVVGGGNILRGAIASDRGIDRATADYMGMIGTVINSLALMDALERAGVETRVLSAIHIQEVCEPFIRRRAASHLDKGRVVIMAAGTGNPYFSTDTAAALRAAELGAEVLLKATKVDGVYDADPMKVKTARRFVTLSYIDAIDRNLKVMDSTAISLCMDNNIPIIVFDFHAEGNIRKAVCGGSIGTIVGNVRTVMADSD